jgi:hypothetical protein
MEILEISGDNVEEFSSLLGEDISEDMKRVFYRGIGVKDDEDKPVGAFIFELIGSESEEDTKSVIRYAVSDNDETTEAMHSSYKDDAVYDEDIVESSYEFDDEPEADICASGGFSKEQKESDKVKVTLAQIAETEFGKQREVPDYINNIADLSVMQYRCAIKHFLFKGQKGVIEDLAYLPMNWFDSNLSMCSVSDGNVDGLFLVRTTPSGVLEPVFLCAYGPDAVKNLFYMLSASAQKALEEYPPETDIVVRRVKKNIQALIDKFAPGLKGQMVFYGSRKE